MPVWFTFFVALVATGGFFFGLYTLVLLLVEGRRTQSRPRLGVSKGDSPKSLTFWVTWNPNQFAIEIYRLRAKLTNPYGTPKERTFTVTFDPPQKAPFAQSVTLPSDIVNVIEDENFKHNAIFTVDFRTIDEMTSAVDIRLPKLRSIYRGASAKAPKGAHKLAPVEIDPPAVTSLEYSELVVRRKKLKDLEAAAKAKAAKAPPKPSEPIAPPAAAPAKPSTPAQSSSTASSNPVPSIKSMIAQDNAKKEASKS